MKKKLCLSFSMGETSAFMTQWCLEHLKDEYEMVVVCANTGDEHEESLIFGDKCDKYFGWDMVWVECVTNPQHNKGVTAKVVTFETASRDGEPFEGVIAKHGIPNQNFSHCSRELKEYTIKSYLRKQLGWKKYEIAIGIRADEPARLNWIRTKDIELPIKFFRGNETVDDIMEDSKLKFTLAVDERLLTNVQYDFWEQDLDENFGCTESCEAF